MQRNTLVILTVLVVLIIDQAVKFWVKTNMFYGEEFLLFDLEWARIHFVENEGMAFGISWGNRWGKLLLTLFRIILSGFLVYLLVTFIKKKYPRGFLFCFALILGGAIGNIIDSTFYGVLFSASTYHTGPAEFLPEGGGYAGLFYGRVVDMLYFPLINTILPGWVPIWGGERFEFFRPVFNVADSAISIGLISILIFYNRFFRGNEE